MNSVKIVSHHSTNKAHKAIYGIYKDHQLMQPTLHNGKPCSLLAWAVSEGKLALSTAYDWEICPNDERTGPGRGNWITLKAYPKQGENT